MTDTERARSAQKIEEPLHELIDGMPLDMQSDLRRTASSMLTTLGGSQFTPTPRNSPLVQQMAADTAEAKSKSAKAEAERTKQRDKDRSIVTN